MTNYQEKLQNLIEKGATVEEIAKAIDTVNKEIYANVCKDIAYNDKPFNALYANDVCTIYGLNEKTRVLTEKYKRVKSADVEKAYKLIHSKETNKYGKPLPNNDVTIFGDFKLVCALHSFIKKCNKEITKEVYTFDKKLYVDKVVSLDFSNIMDSKTALDKAINNIVLLVGIDATYKKKYNDSLAHFATKQRVNAKGVIISDASVYELMDYIIDCCKDRLTVKLSYMKEKKTK